MTIDRPDTARHDVLRAAQNGIDAIQRMHVEVMVALDALRERNDPLFPGLLASYRDVLYMATDRADDMVSQGNEG